MKQIKFYLLIALVKLLNPKWWKIPTEAVLAQSILETGNFTSDIFLQNKNMFGMKQATIRDNKALTTANGHAVYKSYWASVKDYFLRQEYFNITKPTSVEDYLNKTVASNYAEDPNYFSKWKEIFLQYQSKFSTAKTIVIALVIGISGIIIYTLYWAYCKYIKKKPITFNLLKK